MLFRLAPKDEYIGKKIKQSRVLVRIITDAPHTTSDKKHESDISVRMHHQIKYVHCIIRVGTEIEGMAYEEKKQTETNQSQINSNGEKSCGAVQ